MYDPSFRLPRSTGLLMSFTKLWQVFNVSTIKKVILCSEAYGWKMIAVKVINN